MKVELFALCDAATNYQGKLNILGTFDAIWTREVPVVHQRCAIALRLRFLRIEEGVHKIKIAIVDADGSAVSKPFETDAAIQFQDALFSSVGTNMILNFQGIKFEKYGEYSIDLSIDGRHEASLPINVSEMPEQQM